MGIQSYLSNKNFPLQLTFKQPVVVTSIEQHPTSQHPENHQVSKTRSGHVFKPPECYTS